jgi:hypothetical protein
MIMVTNSGLASVGVDLFGISRPFMSFAFNPLVIFLGNRVRLIQGDELDGLIVAGGTSRSWTYEIRIAGLGSRETNDPEKILKTLRWSRIYVSLGDGKTAQRRRIRPFSVTQNLGSFRYPDPEVW